MSEYSLMFKPKILETMKLYKLFSKIIGRGIPFSWHTAQVSEQEA